MRFLLLETKGILTDTVFRKVSFQFQRWRRSQGMGRVGVPPTVTATVPH